MSKYASPQAAARSQSATVTRRVRYIYSLRNLSRLFKRKSYEVATKEEIGNVVSEIESEDTTMKQADGEETHQVFISNAEETFALESCSWEGWINGRDRVLQRNWLALNPEVAKGNVY